jgi:hypothetical protein
MTSLLLPNSNLDATRTDRKGRIYRRVWLAMGLLSLASTAILGANVLRYGFSNSLALAAGISLVICIISIFFLQRSSNGRRAATIIWRLIATVLIVVLVVALIILYGLRDLAT